MILRRVIAHFRRQEWTAIFIDFVIVVLGVFVGLQVNNWNESRKGAQLESAYLERLAADIEATISKFDDARRSGAVREEICGAMVKAAFDPATPDGALVEATKRFIAEGWNTPAFDAVDAAYRDLQSSGNMHIIRDPALRAAVSAMYQRFEDRRGRALVDQTWALTNDARLAYEADVLRWRPEFAGLYPPLSNAEAAGAIGAYRHELGRVAATYLLIVRTVNRDLNASLDEARRVLKAVEAARDGAG